MNLSRGLAAAMAACVAMSCPALVLGDGKVFRHSEAVVPMVDQEAVIVFKDGVEVLAIRTRADGRAAGSESLAWVVPVPAEPEVLTATDGTFDTARAISVPRLLDDRSSGLGAFLFLFSLVIFCASALVRLNPGVSRGQRVAMGLIVGVLGPLMCVAGLLPSLGRARGAPGAAESGPQVQVLQRTRVGTLDVSVVRAAGGGNSATALAAWLAEAG